MEIKSILDDKRVNAKSILIEVRVGDYINLAKKIIRNNDFQRKRVRGSKSVYSLLKKDFLEGCVIPPIVLAYTRPGGNVVDEGLSAFKDHALSFSILDGLQRTYTILDIAQDISDNEALAEEFSNRLIRCEIYQGIERLGILYRMLTLNTGQTAMSLRHQIEIMYMDYLHMPIEGVEFIREKDSSRARKSNRYNFKDVIDGFNSYIERNESPLDRSDILENISSLEHLSKENKNQDIFKNYVLAWNGFINKIDSLKIEYKKDQEESYSFLDDDDDDDEDEATLGNAREWAKNGVRAFKRGQSLSGFGAAIGLLRDDDPSIQFNELPINDIIIGGEPEEFLDALNRTMSLINDKARRIGNSQRLYFRQFFRMLFWKNSGCYLNLIKSEEEAYKSAQKFGI